jgi:DNA-binding transcriptional LysR family regulator
VDVDVVLWLSDAEGPTPGPSFITEAPRPLARLHYLPHIAKRYSRLTTRPDSVDDLDDYMLVQWQPDAQVNALQPWNRVVEQRLAAVVQVQAYSLMLEMIRCGACIGLLPHYMSSFDRGLWPCRDCWPTACSARSGWRSMPRSSMPTRCR